jgi:hypothetical protein
MDIAAIGIIVGFALLNSVFLFWNGGREKPTIPKGSARLSGRAAT